MVLQELQHEAVVHQTFPVQLVQDVEVPEAGPALIHHLGLALWVEVLGDLAHDTDDLPLPGFQQGCVFLQEVQDVFLRLFRETLFQCLAGLALASGNGAPQVIDLLLQQFLTFQLSLLFLLHGQGIGTLVAVHPVHHQGVTGIQYPFHLVHPVALFAVGDEFAREQHVVDDGLGVCPGAEHVVVLEKRVVTVAGVGKHQRLHGQGVFLHQVSDAGVGVEYDLIGQAHVSPAIAVLHTQEMLAE